MDLSHAEAQVRRRHGGELITALTGANDELRPVVSAEPAARPGYLRLLVSASEPWVPLRLKRASQLGILPSYPVSLAELSGFRERLGPVGRMRGADWVVHQLVTFTTYGRVGEGDLDALRRMVARRVVPVYG